MGWIHSLGAPAPRSITSRAFRERQESCSLQSGSISSVFLTDCSFTNAGWDFGRSPRFALAFEIPQDLIRHSHVRWLRVQSFAEQATRRHSMREGELVMRIWQRLV